MPNLMGLRADGQIAGIRELFESPVAVRAFQPVGLDIPDGPLVALAAEAALRDRIEDLPDPPPEGALEEQAKQVHPRLP